MAKIYGALEVAQLEWFTQSPDTRPLAASNTYRVIYASDVKQVQVSNGTGWVSAGAYLVTYTSGTLPSAASNPFLAVWVSDLQQVQVSNGTAWVAVGATSGLKNYFSQNNANPNFETNSVTPWSACTLTFSSGVPSGAPTLTATQMSIATTASTPLAGTYSMQLTKAAANAQYQGFISGALTIDREDTAKVLYGSFSYEVVSGTVDFSGASTQTYEIWIYNTVSGAWTQPAGYRGMNQSSGIGKVTFSFQTDGSTANNSYKIAVITQQTGTGAIVVEFDSFQIGPSAIVLGAAMTDWQSYTPTTAGLGTISAVNMFWRRVGSNLEVMGNLTTGTVTAVEAQIGLPAGITSTSNISTIQQAGLVILGAVTSNVRNLLIETSKTYLTVGIANATSQLTKQLGTTFANTIVLSFQASIPVQGWSSNVQISSDTDTRVVAATAILTTAPTFTSGGTTIAFDSVSIDTHGAYNKTTGVYTVPVSGNYIVKASLYPPINGYMVVQKTGSTLYRLGQVGATVTGNIIGASPPILCNAGDQLTIVALLSSGTSASGTLGTTLNYVGFERLSGPSVIAASETVAMTYTGTATGTLTTGGTNFLATVPTKVFDTHNAYASGLFTVPVSGKYQVSAQLHINATYVGGITTARCEIRQAGSASTAIIGQQSWPSGASNNPTRPNASIILNCIAGDTIGIYGGSDGSSLSYGAQCSLSIERVGN